MKIQSTHTTSLHPCGLELACIDEHAYLVCGCYELKDESEARREGCLEVFPLHSKASQTSSSSSSSMLSLQSPSIIPCSSGVLDLKVDGDVAATALSEGKMVIYHLHREEEEVKGEGEGEEDDHKVTAEIMLSYSQPEEGLFLSVDSNQPFSHFLHQTCNDAKVVISTQASSIILCEVMEGGEDLTVIDQKSSAHCLLGEPMPVWTVAMDKFHHRYRYLSGGDDCIFRMWDSRVSGPAQAMSKYHRAGVTTAQWHPQVDNLFLTGSYDEECCVWDVRSLRQPIHSIQTGGGVWRAKWLSASSGCKHENTFTDGIVTTAMQAGCSIHSLSGSICYDGEEEGEGKGRVTALQHSSSFFSDERPSQLIYDVLLVPNNIEDRKHWKVGSEIESDREGKPSHLYDQSTLVACSFYDSLVYLLSPV
eukprot:gene1103-1198_t